MRKPTILKQKNKHRLIGVDPGTNVLGYAVIESEGQKLKLIDYGILKMAHLASHQLKLNNIFKELQGVIQLYNVEEMAVEAPFHGKNIQSMLKLGRAQGAAILAATTKGLHVTEYAPKKIKLSITGNGNASKEQVAAMLENILHIKIDQKQLDATDALATAVCHHYQKGTMAGAGKKYGSWSSFVKDNPGRAK